MSEISYTIVTVNEFREKYDQFSHAKELLHSLGSIRYCKAEIFKDCIFGTMRVPLKSAERKPQMVFGFYMTEDRFLFIEDTGELKRWLEKHREQMEKTKSPDQILLQVLGQLVENDLMYLLHLEKELEQMEDTLVDQATKDFFSVLTRYRQKLSELNAYYEQMLSVCDVMQSHENPEMIRSSEPWDRFSLRIDRLHNHVHLLQENTVQLRELYQSKQDAQQNKIMCILTVVTTLFLPLTLLTGWYGMNFAFMPELQWKYGYLTVIIVAVTTVILEIIYFKKKKFF